MKKIFSLAMASLLAMSCASTSKDAAETSEPTSITWIEDDHLESLARLPQD